MTRNEMRIGLGVFAMLGVVLLVAPKALSEDPAPLRHGTIVGVVATSDGERVADAHVVLLNARGEVVARTVSGERGRFGFRAVRPGRYVVEATKRGVGSGRTRVGVRSGG